MKFRISEEIKKQYPNLKIGIVVAKGIKNRKEDNEFEKLKKESINNISDNWTIEELVNHPNIIAWRNTYKSFGIKPKKCMPTAESIIRRVIKNKMLPQISVAVDAYILVELQYFLPIGGYDLDSIDGDIQLRLSSGNEDFIPLGGGNEKTIPDEVIYSDDSRVLTIHWNYLDSDETKITLSTKNFVLFIEATDETIDMNDLLKATESLKKILQQFCPGEYSSHVIEANNISELEL